MRLLTRVKKESSSFIEETLEAVAKTGPYDQLHGWVKKWVSPPGVRHWMGKRAHVKKAIELVSADPKSCPEFTGHHNK